MSANNAALARYYRLHAGIYDATRWSFLFGREALLRRVRAMCEPASILEVGCGTGRNLASLARLFPKANLTGIDLSGEMLAQARRRLKQHFSRVNLMQQAYGQTETGRHDLIIASYALSMFNPGWENAIKAAAADLRPGGIIAIVDFSHSDACWFEHWMRRNHVRMQAHLWPLLRDTFAPLKETISPAYGGLWHYGMFIGRK